MPFSVTGTDGCNTSNTGLVYRLLLWLYIYLTSDIAAAVHSLSLSGQCVCGADAIRTCTATLMLSVKRRGISLHACHTWAHNLTQREPWLLVQTVIRPISLILLTELASLGKFKLTMKNLGAQLNKGLSVLCLSKIYIGLACHPHLLLLDY